MISTQFLVKYSGHKFTAGEEQKRTTFFNHTSSECSSASGLAQAAKLLRLYTGPTCWPLSDHKRLLKVTGLRPKLHVAGILACRNGKHALPKILSKVRKSSLSFLEMRFYFLKQESNLRKYKDQSLETFQ